MNKEDMIIEAGKRTFRELVQNIKDTPPFIAPFAVIGLIVGHWWATVAVIIIMLVWEGFQNYEVVHDEEVFGLKASSGEDVPEDTNIQTEEVSTEDKK